MRTERALGRARRTDDEHVFTRDHRQKQKADDFIFGEKLSGQPSPQLLEQHGAISCTRICRHRLSIVWGFVVSVRGPQRFLHSFLSLQAFGPGDFLAQAAVALHLFVDRATCPDVRGENQRRVHAGERRKQRQGFAQRLLIRDRKWWTICRRDPQVKQRKQTDQRAQGPGFSSSGLLPAPLRRCDRCGTALGAAVPKLHSDKQTGQSMPPAATRDKLGTKQRAGGGRRSWVSGLQVPGSATAAFRFVDGQRQHVMFNRRLGLRQRLADLGRSAHRPDKDCSAP